MKDGIDILNQTYDNLIFNSLQLTDAGIYKCRVVTEGGETVYSHQIIVNNVTSVPEKEMVTDFQVFPNPFFDHAILKWQQKSTAQVRVDILYVSGKLIRTITHSIYLAGVNEIEFANESKILPSEYILRLIANSSAQTCKLQYSR